MGDPGGDWWLTRARYAVDLAVIDGEDLPGPLVELATLVLVTMLKAGLPPYSIEAAAEGDETGVALAPVPGRRALRVLWRQDPAAQAHMPAERWHAQQAAMNQALRAILAAQAFWIEDGPLGEPPVVLGLTRLR
jgi:hypothetical protein